MINKEVFIKYIREYQEFDSDVDRIEEALSGKKYGCNLYECGWVISVGKMLDLFIESHFTEVGADLIYYYIFEDCNHIIYETQEEDLFNNREELKYELNTLDDLWEYMTDEKRIKLYVKEINN